MHILMEICLEELDDLENNAARTDPDEDAEAPFIRCVALPGGEPGLALDRAGQIRWMEEKPAAYGLWTSADGRLALLRNPNATPMTVARGGRTLQVPPAQPVILRNGDVLHLGGRRYRVHVHGETDVIHPPERISRSTVAKWVGAAAAASLAFGSLAGATAAAPSGSAADSIEVRLHPPKPAPRKRPVYCAIKKQKKTKKGLSIDATCSMSRGLRVGLWGYVIKKKTGAVVSQGRVQIKAVNGKKIDALAPDLSKPVKGARLKFIVRYF